MTDRYSDDTVVRLLRDNVDYTDDCVVAIAVPSWSIRVGKKPPEGDNRHRGRKRKRDRRYINENLRSVKLCAYGSTAARDNWSVVVQLETPMSLSCPLLLGV